MRYANAMIPSTASMGKNISLTALMYVSKISLNDACSLPLLLEVSGLLNADISAKEEPSSMYTVLFSCLLSSLFFFFISTLVLKKVARGKVTGLVLSVGGRDMLALFRRMRTSGVEAAALGRIGGRRNISLENDAVHLHVGIGVGDRREERLGIGMQRICKDILLCAKLYHRSKIHHADLIRQELDYRKIVRNKEICKV